MKQREGGGRVGESRWMGPSLRAQKAARTTTQMEGKEVTSNVEKRTTVKRGKADSGGTCQRQRGKSRPPVRGDKKQKCKEISTAHAERGWVVGEPRKIKWEETGARSCPDHLKKGVQRGSRVGKD